MNNALDRLEQLNSRLIIAYQNDCIKESAYRDIQHEVNMLRKEVKNLAQPDVSGNEALRVALPITDIITHFENSRVSREAIKQSADYADGYNDCLNKQIDWVTLREKELGNDR